MESFDFVRDLFVAKIEVMVSLAKKKVLNCVFV